MRDVEESLGARDGDVSQAALLFEFGDVGRGTRVREEAIFEADDEDEWELKTFGRVDGH